MLAVLLGKEVSDAHDLLRLLPVGYHLDGGLMSESAILGAFRAVIPDSRDGLTVVRMLRRWVSERDEAGLQVIGTAMILGCRLLPVVS